MNFIKEAFESKYIAPFRPMVDAFKWEFPWRYRLSPISARSILNPTISQIRHFLLKSSVAKLQVKRLRNPEAQS